MESRKEIKIDRWHSEEKEGLFQPAGQSRSEIELRIEI